MTPQRLSRQASPGRSAKPSPIIKLDANEELTFILSGCNALKTDGIDIRIIDTKGSIKLKGHGFLYLMGAKDGLLGEGDDYDFSKLAADGYTVERTREDFGYMYTVYKKDIVDMKDVTSDKSADGNSIWVYDFNQGTFLEKSNKSWSFRVLPCLAF